MSELVYKIGNYKCSSKEEYDAMKSDLKEIKEIRIVFDENSLEGIEKILKYITGNKEVLTTKLGEQYKKSLLSKYKSYNAERSKLIDKPINKKTVVKGRESRDEEIEKNKSRDEVVGKSHEAVIKNNTTSNMIPTEVTNDTKYVPLPIDIKLPKEKNLLYILFAFVITCLSSFLILIDRIESYNFFGNGIGNHIDDGGEIAIIWITIMFTITTVIGISEYVRIQGVYKAISEAEEKLFNDKNAKKDEKDGYGCLAAILGIIAILIPPILIILMIIAAIFISMPKFRWLKMNVKAIIAFIVYFFGNMIVGSGMILVFDVLYIRGIGSLRTNGIIISLCVGLICVGFIYRVAKSQRKPINYGFRAMCAVPIMIFMALLPFAGIAAYSYMLYGEKSSTSGYVAPGVHTVAGHERHLQNGSVVWINPYPRTNPDGILWNNFSYKG
ncbi:MAG TPA: hypothetical protein GXZ21_01120 [Clostridiales bacterium]|nr:hypothetical protein [Clostridiales bacterium]